MDTLSHFLSEFGLNEKLAAIADSDVVDSDEAVADGEEVIGEVPMVLRKLRHFAIQQEVTAARLCLDAQLLQPDKRDECKMIATRCAAESLALMNLFWNFCKLFEPIKATTYHSLGLRSGWLLVAVPHTQECGGRITSFADFLKAIAEED